MRLLLLIYNYHCNMPDVTHLTIPNLKNSISSSFNDYNPKAIEFSVGKSIRYPSILVFCCYLTNYYRFSNLK